MSINYLFECVPDFCVGLLGTTFRGFDVVCVTQCDQAVHDERLEKFERHFLGDAALVQLELWSGDDDGAPTVVDAFS